MHLDELCRWTCSLRSTTFAWCYDHGEPVVSLVIDKLHQTHRDLPSCEHLHPASAMVHPTVVVHRAPQNSVGGISS